MTEKLEEYEPGYAWLQYYERMTDGKERRKRNTNKRNNIRK